MKGGKEQNGRNKERNKIKEYRKDRKWKEERVG